MIAYKDKQFLVFKFEDGKDVKYNLATKETIGKSGKIVKSINSQLTGYDLRTVINAFEDENYKNYLHFLDRYVINILKGGYYGSKITNVGSFLNRINDYTYFEQYFSAGVKKISNFFYYRINELPKGYVNFCKKYNIEINDLTLEKYKNHSSILTTAVEEEFNTLKSSEVISLVAPDYSYSWSECIIVNNHRVRKPEAESSRWGKSSNDYFKILTETYNYNWKRLLHYLDDLLTYEGINSLTTILGELTDYNRMLSEMSTHKYEKYPKYFLSMHSIVCRNYNRLNHQFPVDDFTKRVDKKMEYKFKDYIFIYPETPDEIKDEAVQQTNCVAGYIQDVLDGKCHIVFLRNKNTPKQSLVTIEVKNNQVVQALRAFNKPISSSEQTAINYYNKFLLKLAKGRMKEKGNKVAIEISKSTNKLKNKKEGAIA
jgi:hypothetical protein